MASPYTTDIQEQAERWVVRKARIENRNPNRCCKPVVSAFEWNDQATAQFEKINNQIAFCMEQALQITERDFSGTLMKKPTKNNEMT